MRKVFESFYERYRAHHDMERPLLQWIGVVGFIAFPLFYVLRRKAALEPGYDDLSLRLVASALCLLLALRSFWPERLKRFYIGYSYLTVFYCLSFLLSFTMLKNQGGTPAVMNMLIGAIIVVLLADWRNTVLILVAGYVLATLAYGLTEPVLRIPHEFVIGAGSSILVVVAGTVSHYGQKRAELERMRRVYSGLAGSIAHEMRTPLAHVQHTLDTIDAILARAGHPGGLARQQHGELSEAVLQGRQAVARGLQGITMTLQELSGRAIDTRDFTPLSAFHCVRKAVDEYAYENARQRGSVNVRMLEDFAFRGEETAFVLILFNLLKNALYYLPVHPHAAITITVEREPFHRVVVHDTGPGIAPELAGRLFEEFQSVGKSEGTGLGLAFCRRVMQAFGGEIACRSEPGRFTEFTLSFPPLPATEAASASANAPAAALPGVAPASLAGQTVMVVDDSAFNRAIVKARLGELGMHAVEAQHGEEALRMIDEGARPAAILMDLQMPGLNGVDATRALRRRPAPACTIPVLGLSANDLPATRERALAVGMAGYLAKPLQPELLRAELRRVLHIPPSNDPVASSGHSARM
jgi:signal transduction histidine kinase/ActR/RegA family two-component response regulator